MVGRSDGVIAAAQAIARATQGLADEPEAATAQLLVAVGSAMCVGMSKERLLRLIETLYDEAERTMAAGKPWPW